MPTTAATLDSIIFEVDELNFEEVGSLPILISSVSSLQVLDSYLQTSSGEKKLYRPSPQNTPVSWELNLILDKQKIELIYILIQKQMKITREFRRNKNTSELAGFTFSVNYNNLLSEPTSVWLSSLTVSAPFFKINKAASIDKEVFKTKIAVAEVE